MRALRVFAGLRDRLAVALAGLLTVGIASTAVAQIPQPHIADVNQRSGLLQRFTPAADESSPRPAAG